MVVLPGRYSSTDALYEDMTLQPRGTKRPGFDQFTLDDERARVMPGAPYRHTSIQVQQNNRCVVALRHS
jgi:hypothetical protein